MIYREVVGQCVILIDEVDRHYLMSVLGLYLWAGCNDMFNIGRIRRFIGHGNIEGHSQIF